MIIRVAANGQVAIEDAMNFRKFKVACDALEAKLEAIKAARPRGISFEDANSAWVSCRTSRSPMACSPARSGAASRPWKGPCWRAGTAT